MFKPPPKKYHLISPKKHTAWVKTLPCVTCGAKRGEIDIAINLPYPICETCETTVDVNELARRLNMLSHDITAAINIIMRMRDGEKTS